MAKKRHQKFCNAIPGVSQRGRKGVAEVSHGCRKFGVTGVCSLFALDFATLAIPLRYPCDGGGVEK